MVSVHACWAIYCWALFIKCEVISNWNWFVMSNQKSKLWTICWAPCLYSSVHSCLVQVNCAFWTMIETLCALRQMFFFSSPTKLCCLMQSFRYKSINRPSVPKLICWLFQTCSLSITFSNVNALDFKVSHQLCPLMLSCRLLL